MDGVVVGAIRQAAAAVVPVSGAVSLVTRRSSLVRRRAEADGR